MQESLRISVLARRDVLRIPTRLHERWAPKRPCNGALRRLRFPDHHSKVSPTPVSSAVNMFLPIVDVCQCVHRADRWPPAPTETSQVLRLCAVRRSSTIGTWRGLP